MNAAKFIYLGIAISVVTLAGADVKAEVVEYTLENVILDDNNAQMFGTFSWTYVVGDFENGIGQFSYLDIPYTSHDHTDLDATIDVGSSIEITLEGSVHDDGVDITLFLVQPLTPTSGSAVDLSRSQYEIGGNGFHTGIFLSGSVEPTAVTAVGDGSTSPETIVDAPTWSLAIYPNPFNPVTTLSYDLPRSSSVSLRIFDVGGRVVKTLVAEEYHAAGRFEVRWNGHDDGGRMVPSGTYFARMQAGNEAVTRKVMLLK